MKYAERMEVVRGSVIRDVATEISARKNPNLITLSGGLPQGTLFPIKELQDVTNAIFEDTDLAIEALQYGLTRGDEELVSLLAARLQKNEKMPIDDTNIIITTGCQQGIALTATALVNEGDTILIEKPSYLDGLNACLPYEANIVGVDTDDEGIQLGALKAKLDSDPRVRLIYVIPNFQNPTGKAWSLKRREELLELVSRPEYDHVTVLEDNPYGEIRFKGEFVPTLKALDKANKVVYISSFSKILCPGLRVAYLVAEKIFVDRIEEIKEGSDLQSNQFAQLQVREYMKKYDLDAHVDEIKAAYKAKCDVMIEAMKKEFPEGVKYNEPEGGMFMWVELPENVDTNKLLSKALDAEVSYIPGSSFFADGSGKNTMRINYTASSPEKIQEGIAKLGKLFKEVIE